MDKKFFFQILGLVIVILSATALTFNPDIIPNLGSLNQATRPTASVSLNNVLEITDPATGQVKAQVKIEIADTKEKRSLGLGGRATLSADAGMLFVMEQRNKPTFWMKGMQIPLDFIWIDGDRVVDIQQNIQPPSAGQSDQSLQLFSPIADIDKMLEVNAGYALRAGIKVGDVIKVFQIVPTQQ